MLCGQCGTWQTNSAQSEGNDAVADSGGTELSWGKAEGHQKLPTICKHMYIWSRDGSQHNLAQLAEYENGALGADSGS